MFNFASQFFNISSKTGFQFWMLFHWKVRYLAYTQKYTIYCSKYLHVIHLKEEQPFKTVQYLGLVNIEYLDTNSPSINIEGESENPLVYWIPDTIFQYWKLPNHPDLTHPNGRNFDQKPFHFWLFPFSNINGFNSFVFFWNPYTKTFSAKNNTYKHLLFLAHISRLPELCLEIPTYAVESKTLRYLTNYIFPSKNSNGILVKVLWQVQFQE